MRRICCIHTSRLPGREKVDSLSAMMADGEGHVRLGIWTGTVWRPSPGKRGACLHSSLVARPGSCIRRLGGTRAREMQFTRFLRNKAVTAAALSEHAAERTAARVADRDI